MFQLNLAISKRMRQVVKIFSKYLVSRTLTLNDEILTVGYLFVASSQAGLSRPVISIFGAKFPAGQSASYLHRAYRAHWETGQQEYLATRTYGKVQLAFHLHHFDPVHWNRVSMSV